MKDGVAVGRSVGRWTRTRRRHFRFKNAADVTVGRPRGGGGFREEERGREDERNEMKKEGGSGILFGRCPP